jgi:hypothetical protein
VLDPYPDPDPKGQKQKKIGKVSNFRFVVLGVLFREMKAIPVPG